MKARVLYVAAAALVAAALAFPLWGFAMAAPRFRPLFKDFVHEICD